MFITIIVYFKDIFSVILGYMIVGYYKTYFNN